MNATADSAEQASTPNGRGTDPTAPGRLTAPVMIGRAEELARLRQVGHHPPALITVEGEAGIGKTRLIREWLAEPALTGTARLVGHCPPMREPFPFGPVIDALASATPWLPEPAALSPVTGALRPLLPELADRLPPPLAPLGNSRQERHRVFRGIRDLLASLGRCVLVLEDLHWIDGGTRELLRFLVDRLPEQLTLVLSYRREDLVDPTAPTLIPSSHPEVHGLRLVLRPLEVAQVAELVRAIRYAEATETVVGHLYQRTMGIPLAVEESLALLWDRQFGAGRRPSHPRPPDDVHVPPVLREALLERVKRLRGAARRLLYAAAVLAAPATEDLLARVAGLSAPHGNAGLSELVRRALLRPAPDNRYSFQHGLAQQAVGDSIAEPVRRQLHRRAVRALRALPSPPLVELARHCRAAGLVDDWSHYAEAAADQAVAVGDDRTATGLLRDLVSRPGASRDTRVRLAIKLGRAALTGIGHAEALAVLRQNLADSGLPRATRGELRLCLGVLLRNQAGSAREGWSELLCAVGELRDRPAPAARAMASLGAPYLLDGRHVDEHMEWLDRAGRTASRTGDAQLHHLVDTTRASALVGIGDPTGWRIQAGLAPGPDPPHQADQLRRVRLAVSMAWAAVCVGRYQETDSLLGTGGRLVEDSTGSYLASCLTGTALLYEYAVGRWDGLADRAGGVAAARFDAPAVVAEARLVLGLLALATGELREAQAHLRQASGSVPVAVAGAAGLARLAAASGDVAGQTHWIRRGLDLVRGKGVWCWAAELVPVAAVLLGRTPRQLPVARKLLDEFAAGITDRDTPLADAAGLFGRALLAEADGQHLAAAAQHREAALAYSALPYPYLAAQAWEARGRCLLAAGQDGAATLAEALAMFERLGATWDVARCQRLLRSLGRRLPHRRGRRGYGAELSPRERDVVRLVRTGLTNREIAETLFLSPRTVEAHVARALRKLALPSRRALVHSDGATTVLHSGRG
jgi:DNA-binding CsgD family transcriptional regulator